MRVDQPLRRRRGGRAEHEFQSGIRERGDRFVEPFPYEFARARFSTFKVGAALETDTGRVVSGCNVENATYGLTMCAERVALYKAVSEAKELRFTRIAVVADTADPTPPCGSCRQLLWEYCGDIDVILANLSEVKRRMKLSQLLPLPFDVRLLE